MKVGYVRVSSSDQNPARQLELMERLNVEKIFSEKISGKNTDRPQFQEMLGFLREGDMLCVESISRLSRSTKDLLNTVEKLQAKKVQLYSEKESIDTTTPSGKFTLTVFAALSELERENILTRQREGIEIAKKEGKYKGRKPIDITEEFVKIANNWTSGNITLQTAIKKSGVSSSTFFRKCKELGIHKES